jgi:hypothetical protein
MLIDKLHTHTHSRTFTHLNIHTRKKITNTYESARNIKFIQRYIRSIIRTDKKYACIISAIFWKLEKDTIIFSSHVSACSFESHVLQVLILQFPLKIFYTKLEAIRSNSALRSSMLHISHAILIILKVSVTNYIAVHNKLNSYLEKMKMEQLDSKF